MDLTDEYKIPPELSAFVDDGFLIPLTPTPEEKTISFDIPSMGYQDERDNDYSFTLIWIHPDFNKDFCHYYHETPGDLPILRHKGIEKHIRRTDRPRFTG